MSNANQQIVTAYEEAQMSPEEIASEYGWELEAVKTILLQYSSEYYKKVKGEVKEVEKGKEVEEQLFDQQDQDIARDAMKRLLMTAENEDTIYRTAKFIINERKGRHDVKALKDTKVNINQFNIHIQKAKEVVQRARAAIATNGNSSLNPTPAPPVPATKLIETEVVKEAAA